MATPDDYREVPEAEVPDWVRKEWRQIGREGRKQHFQPWRLGDGWKYVRRRFATWNDGRCYLLGDTSEGCILLALADLCRERGVDPRELYAAAHPDEDNDFDGDQGWRQEAEPVTILPLEWTRADIVRLVEDLGDVNCHSLAAVVAERFDARPADWAQRG